MFKISNGVKKIFVLVLGLTLLAAACNKPATTTINVSNPPPAANPNPPPAANPAPPPIITPTSGSTVEIGMTENGFSPAAITVKLGTKVVFKNKDSQGHWPASNPHPTHTDLPGFDAKQPIATGDDYSYTFTKIGTWGFHDHLNPTMHGAVIVTP